MDERNARDDELEAARRVRRFVTEWGGPAFPAGPGADALTPVEARGLSVRDWLAGQALAGLLASAATDNHVRRLALAGEASPEQIRANLADVAYGYAEAMLNRREV